MTYTEWLAQVEHLKEQLFSIGLDRYRGRPPASMREVGDPPCPTPPKSLLEQEDEIRTKIRRLRSILWTDQVDHTR